MREEKWFAAAVFSLLVAGSLIAGTTLFVLLLIGNAEIAANVRRLQTVEMNYDRMMWKCKEGACCRQELSSTTTLITAPANVPNASALQPSPPRKGKSAAPATGATTKSTIQRSKPWPLTAIQAKTATPMATPALAHTPAASAPLPSIGLGLVGTAIPAPTSFDTPRRRIVDRPEHSAVYPPSEEGYFTLPDDRNGIPALIPLEVCIVWLDDAADHQGACNNVRAGDPMSVEVTIPHEVNGSTGPRPFMLYGGISRELDVVYRDGRFNPSVEMSRKRWACYAAAFDSGEPICIDKKVARQ